MLSALTSLTAYINRNLRRKRPASDSVMCKPIPLNKVEPPEVHAHASVDLPGPITSTSPSGRYKLEITEEKTKPGCWNYTNCIITLGYKSIEKTVRLRIQRNYPSFPFYWVEGHPDGHDYLLCGSDYQGQTVVRLDTGERFDYRPGNAIKGFGFCIANYVDFVPEERGGQNILTVEGCIWACPYEIITYDLSNPTVFPWPILSRTVAPIEDEDNDEEDDA